ncbi:hypothetical protein [Mycetocola saprophilus]|uniref:hypothetical protein n=1 Tax=Mycetocola saprophilus TaxID=76636 RepID=UPI003BF3F8B4
MTEPDPAEHRPAYLRLRRKETRIRPDQELALTQLRQRLNTQREHPGERLTENSLIRIAIDLLLTREHTLTGGDETALRTQLDL